MKEKFKAKGVPSNTAAKTTRPESLRTRCAAGSHKNASENPWYLLATAAGEHNGNAIDSRLHSENRRLWNGWVCQDITDSTRIALAKKLSLPEEELGPLNEEERGKIFERFRRAVNSENSEINVPDPKMVINMSSVEFPLATSFSQFYFSAYTDFGSAFFGGDVDFTSACFIDLAYLESVYFSGRSYFSHVYFSGVADFDSASFRGDTTFEAAHFFGRAYFRNTRFESAVSFIDGSFNAATLFKGAHFVRVVPSFFQRSMAQDTQFSDDPSLWPEANEENAEKGQQAYTRLRQVATENHNPDLEHFFLRQEMRCKEVGAKGIDGLFFLGYRMIADSGISVLRPLVGLFIVVLIGWLSISLHLYSLTESRSAMPITEGLGISIGNTLPFLGLVGKMHPDFFSSTPPWLDVISGMQSISGIVLLFFFGLGLRNRFRLK